MQGISWLTADRLGTQEGRYSKEPCPNLKHYPGITWKKWWKAYNISDYMNHPASYSMGTKSISAGIKRPEGEADHSKTFSIKVSGDVPLRSL
jgi:hypothetical protein